MGRPQHLVLLNREMLYVGELSLMTTERDLFKVFNSVAHVVGVYLPRDGSNFSRGFAFIKFQTANDAARAMHILSNHLLNGKPILVKYAFLDPAMPFFEVGRIFIKSIITLEALRGAFSAFGKILSCVILRDLGYATLCFDNMEASLRALEQMNKFFKGTDIYIDSFMSEEDNALAVGERRKEEWLYLYIDNIDERIGDGHLLRLLSQFGVITSYEVRTYYGRLGREPRLVAFSTPMEGFTACSAMHGQLVGNK